MAKAINFEGYFNSAIGKTNQVFWPLEEIPQKSPRLRYRAVASVGPGGRPPLVGLGRYYIKSFQNNKFSNKNTLVT